MVRATDPYVRILGVLHRSLYFFYQVAPQLYSRGWVEPVPDPLLLSKSCSGRNRTQISGYEARNSDHLTTEAVKMHLKNIYNIYVCVCVLGFFQNNLSVFLPTLSFGTYTLQGFRHIRLKKPEYTFLTISHCFTLTHCTAVLL
jgi:hypothetical protein